MKTLSYHEVLELYYGNIHKSEWIGEDIFQMNLSEHKVYIRYHHKTSLFLCMYQNKEQDIDVYIIFGKHRHYKNEYFLYPEGYNPIDIFDGRGLPLPETSDEWFNFALMHQCTEEDFKLFKKIVQHHENKSST